MKEKEKGLVQNELTYGAYLAIEPRKIDRWSVTQNN